MLSFHSTFKFRKYDRLETAMPPPRPIIRPRRERRKIFQPSAFDDNCIRNFSRMFRTKSKRQNKITQIEKL